MVNFEFPPIGGGAGQAHYNILKQYGSRADLQVDVLTSGINSGLSQEELSANINIFKVGIHKQDLHYWRKVEVIEWLLKARKHFRRLTIENRYDLIHVFFAFPTGWLCYRNTLELPYIISLRGSDVPGFNDRLGLDYRLMSGLFRKIWGRAAKVVANSEGLRTLAQQFMPDLDIGVIPNGVDRSFFRPLCAREPRKPLRLLTVGRLISRKRLDLLIKTVSLSQKKGVDLHLDIAGEGILSKQLRQLAIQLQVSDQVNFLGRVSREKILQVYQSNDVMVMVSSHEGMSNAMLEAMACGLPVITTACEGTEELVVENGLIIDRPDEECIIKAAEQFIRDPQLYKTMSQAAIDRAKLFSWSTVADNYVKCYKDVLSKK